MNIEADNNLHSSEGLSPILIRQWAGRDLLDWETQAKVSAPRILLAKLYEGVDIDEVNDYLLDAGPTGPSGSSWRLRPNADYDFTEIVLSAILHQFGDSPDRLRPETAAHILNNLLIEKGYKIQRTVPGSFWLVGETENHILMTEGSRYLRNLWLMKHGRDDKAHIVNMKRHAHKLMNYIEDLQRSGLYEFNSQPYSGYTITALLILDAYAECSDLKEAVRRLLDTLMYQFALGDNMLRRLVPFRRRFEREPRTLLAEDPLTSIMITWFGDRYGYQDPRYIRTAHQALIAAAMPYRPGLSIQQELGLPDKERTVLIGRGRKASPEIHGQGPGYVISAGGVSWGSRSRIVARPTTLLLDDGAMARNECFSISGSGGFTSWNNTGVYQNFACGPGKLNIPSGLQPVAKAGHFEVYDPGVSENLLIVTYSANEVTILSVVSEWNGSADGLACKTLAENTDKNALTSVFTHPDGHVYEYDVFAKTGTWVIKSVDGIQVDRNYERWSRLEIFCTSKPR